MPLYFYLVVFKWTVLKSDESNEASNSQLWSQLSPDLAAARSWFRNYLHGVSGVMLFASSFHCVWQSIYHMWFDCSCYARNHYNISFEWYAICNCICIYKAHYICISIWVHYIAFIALSQTQCNAMRCFAMQSDCILNNAIDSLFWNIMHCKECNCFVRNALSFFEFACSEPQCKFIAMYSHAMFHHRLHSHSHIHSFKQMLWFH